MPCSSFRCLGPRGPRSNSFPDFTYLPQSSCASASCSRSPSYLPRAHLFATTRHRPHLYPRFREPKAMGLTLQAGAVEKSSDPVVHDHGLCPGEQRTGAAIPHSVRWACKTGQVIPAPQGRGYSPREQTTAVALYFLQVFFAKASTIFSSSSASAGFAIST